MTSTLTLRLRTAVDELAAALDERDRLVRVLQLEPSASDNYDVIGHMTKALKTLHHLQDATAGAGAEVQQLAARYNELVAALARDPHIDVSEYKYVPPPPKTASKSVRFEDEAEADMRNELMGTKAFRPYTDAEDAGVDGLDNKQLFAQHQQQLLRQDSELDLLHGSVAVQKRMGLSINDEIDHHLILLNDLERGVDAAHVKLHRTSTRLGDFRRRVQENGSLATIVVLTVILVLLLVVLN